MTRSLVIPLLAMLALPATGEERPNFLIILADDLGHGDVSSYRQSDVHTPNMDRIAAEGMRFTNMRANATVCSPSRAALLTGRFPDSVGVPGVIRTQPTNSWGYLDPTAPTLANQLSEAGYTTALIGKWHLGLESPNTPNERGFDFFHGFLGDMMDSYTTHRREGNNYMRHNSQVIDPAGHATDLFTEWTVDYLDQRAARPEQPFFLYLAYNAPHFPIEPPAEWLANVQQREPSLSEARAKNVAFVEHLDASIGRVLDALDRLGLAENTLVAFSSDNGGSLPHAQNNDPWRDGKQSHYDGGLRVPFLVRWPAVVRRGTTSDYQGLLFDLFPTLVRSAGARLPEPTDAVDLSPILRGERLPQPRELYFVRREGGARYGGNSYHAIIRGEWKLMRNDPYSRMELYNLREDPQEKDDRAATEPAVARELDSALQRHIQEGGRVPWQPSAEGDSR